MDLFESTFFAMGSYCEVQLYTHDIAEFERTLDLICAEIERIESRYSRYRPESLLSQINHVATAGESILLDDETAQLLDYAFACHRKSQGLFDITSGRLGRIWDFRGPATLPSPAAIEQELRFVGMEKLTWAPPRLAFGLAGMALDLGGIAKEYAADRAVAVCRASGVQHGLISLGGDIAIVGRHPDGAPWRISLQSPEDPSATSQILEVDAGGVATSGDYERCIDLDGRRYSHLLNPHTGWPVQGLSSATVHAANCLMAGSMATIAMLLGQAGTAWLETTGHPFLTLDAAGGKTSKGNSACRICQTMD